MTRIAVIGSSHVGAVRMAQSQIQALYPAVDLRFFAMTAGMFPHAFVDDAGVLQVPKSVGARRERLMRINDAEALDLSSYEHIWIVGPRYLLHSMHRMLRNHGLFGHTKPSEGKMMLTWDFVAAAIEDMVDGAHARLAKAYGRDQRITVTPAPMPSQSTSNPGDFFDRPLKHVTEMPQMERIAGLYEGRIAKCTLDQGWRILPQPQATRVAPFVTHDRYAFRPAEGDNNPLDFRHMGANYGVILARAYLSGVLGLASQPGANDSPSQSAPTQPVPASQDAKDTSA